MDKIVSIALLAFMLGLGVSFALPNDTITLRFEDGSTRIMNSTDLTRWYTGA